MQPTLQTFIGVFVNNLGIKYSMNVWSGIRDPGPRCIKPSKDKRALNFCSGTIAYCFEMIVTSSLNLKMLFATRPRKPDVHVHLALI